MTELFRQAAQWFPMTAKLIPWNPIKGFRAEAFANMPFLVQGAILSRLLIGLLRVAADAPALNPNLVPEEDKWNTFLERTFMEAFGTLGTFVALQAGQDIAAKAIESGWKGIHPNTLLEGLTHQAKSLKLSTNELEQIGQALQKTFHSSDLSKASNILAKKLYDTGKGELVDFERHLANQTLMNKIHLPVHMFFRKANWAGLGVLATGMVASVVFSGPIWQALNDTLVRNRLIPSILKRFRKEAVSPSKLSLVSSAPLEANTISPFNRPVIPQLQSTPSSSPSASYPPLYSSPALATTFRPQKQQLSTKQSVPTPTPLTPVNPGPSNTRSSYPLPQSPPYYSFKEPSMALYRGGGV